ncbi:hypothetical protein CYMTET_44906 [Cymbomonas tetramitiformis]|uniref:Uncharacterized protein n=1 Tax=Cymbomonas tetramitiformis TaxID=36881 RepID=A0AAE0EZ39_9CHLO|nr:hypothetical protein CYMTET_44906 [Cymbomonas tetramitiformis]
MLCCCGHLSCFGAGWQVGYEDYTGATFNSLQIIGEPGRQYNLTFQPATAEWPELILTVQMAACSSGEVYDTVGQTCTPCAPGTIKFDNLTTACTACDNTGLRCHGGSHFTIEPGYWMAEASVRRACAVQDAACVLNRVYACDLAEACSTVSNRTNYNNSMASGIEAAAVTGTQCGEGYRDDVVICGACDTSYSKHAVLGGTDGWAHASLGGAQTGGEVRGDGRYPEEDGSCTRCAGTVVSWVLQVSGVCLAMALLVGILRRKMERPMPINHKGSGQSKALKLRAGDAPRSDSSLGEGMDETSEAFLDLEESQMEAWRLVSIWFGLMQVRGLGYPPFTVCTIGIRDLRPVTRLKLSLKRAELCGFTAGESTLKSEVGIYVRCQAPSHQSWLRAASPTRPVFDRSAEQLVGVTTAECSTATVAH